MLIPQEKTEERRRMFDKLKKRRTINDLIKLA